MSEKKIELESITQHKPPPIIPVIPVIPVIAVLGKPLKRKFDEISNSEINKNQSIENNDKIVQKKGVYEEKRVHEEIKELDEKKLCKKKKFDNDEEFDYPIPKKDILVKIGGMSYVPTGNLIHKANELFGRSRWNTQILETNLYYDGNIVSATIRMRLTVINDDGSVTIHEEWGGGEGNTKSLSQNRIKALKSAVSDAIKRTLRNFGLALGLDLCIKKNK